MLTTTYPLPPIPPNNGWQPYTVPPVSSGTTAGLSRLHTAWDGDKLMVSATIVSLDEVNRLIWTLHRLKELFEKPEPTA
jgi:hypothetical protein